MKTRKILAAALTILILGTVCLPAMAHTTLQVYLLDGNGSTAVGKEDMGWIINETHHLGTTQIKFKFDDTTNGGFSSNQKSLIRSGFGLWNNSPLSVTESSSAIGTVIKDPNIGTSPGYNFIGVVDGDGHYTSWTLRINPAATLTAKILARVLGHIIGLNYLTDSANKNKIMYKGSGTWTATAPHTQDMWGARVITGNHASHSWEYIYHSANKHRKTCSSCGGYKTEGCTPNANGYCTKCGHYVGISPDGIFEPTAALLPNTDEERKLKLSLLI